MTAVIASLFADKILRASDRLTATLDGLDEERASTVPREAANCLAAIVNHALANLEDNVLSVIAGGPPSRDRDSEFSPAGGPLALQQRWMLLRPRVAASLDTIDDERLYRLVHHSRRGDITVAEVLMVVLRHLGEHEGEAALTRSLVAEA